MTLGACFLFISRYILTMCDVLCSKGMLSRNLFLSGLAFSFVMLVCLQVKLGERPVHHLDLDFLYVPLPDDKGGDVVLNYRERVERLMEQHMFRSRGHKYTSLWFTKGLRLPWFMNGGIMRPSRERPHNRNIWPTESNDDRIVDQLIVKAEEHSAIWSLD